MPATRGRVLLAISDYEPQLWLDLFTKEREATLEADGPDDTSIDYAVVWKHEPNQLSGFSNLKAIFSLGAGVDHILADPGLPDVPVVRVVDPNLTQHMTEYVAWRVLDHHRQGALYREQQRQRVWSEAAQQPANETSVGIMGIGELGSVVARALLSLGFQVRGWSRRPKVLDGVTTFDGGDGLPAFLGGTDILVVLLPLTPETTGIVNYELLRQLRRTGGPGGAILINAGRGRLQSDADILQALDDGTLKEASLDVFEVEPLPRSSPMWTHPKVFVTPHAAATSDPRHLVPPMLAQMDAFDRGEPLQNMVDRQAGY